MIDVKTVRKLALALEGAEELPHFEKASFRVKKKIFATIDEKNNRACLCFSAVDQSVFCAYDKTIIYPVPNAWGKKGFTFIELKKVRKDIFTDALKQAYMHILGKAAPKKKASRKTSK